MRLVSAITPAALSVATACASTSVVIPRAPEAQADSARVAFWASGSSLVAFGTVRITRDTIVWLDSTPVDDVAYRLTVGGQLIRTRIDSIPVNDVVYHLTVGRQWIGTPVDSIDFRLPQVVGFGGGGPTQSAIDGRSPKQYLVYARLLGTGEWTMVNIVSMPKALEDIGWLDRIRGSRSDSTHRHRP